MEDGGSIIGLSPHPAGEQLWDGWSGEAGFLDLNLCLIVCLCLGVCVCVGHNLALARHWSHALSPLTGSPALH